MTADATSYMCRAAYGPSPSHIAAAKFARSAPALGKRIKNGAP